LIGWLVGWLVQAIFFYNPEGRGPCLAFPGEKKMINYFRSHLIVVWAAENNGQNINVVTIYDIKNKVTAFEGRFQNIRHVIVEWGTVFLLTADGKVLPLPRRPNRSAHYFVQSNC
jgi:vacuolar protein sorting-associated protein 11